MSAIFDKLQKVFPFDEAGLFHLDFENGKERDLIVDYRYDTSGANQEIQDAEITGWLPMTQLSRELAKKTISISTEGLYELYEHPHFEFTKKIPFQQVKGGPLIQGDQTIGLIYFWSKQENAFDGKQSLFKSITDQMSVALSNIISNERLVEEKQFSETLLEITESIANINRSEDLVTAIFDQLQKVYPFDDAGLFAFDWENERERDLMVDYGYEVGLNTSLHQAGLSGWNPLTELSKFLSQENTMIMMVDELYTTFDHPHFELDKESPLRQVIFGPLKQGDKVMGALYFWSDEEKRFTESDIPIFRSIAKQLSVALSNVLTNEQIILENQQKQLQLRVAEAISQARSVDALLKEVIEHVSPIFGSQEHALIIIDEKNDEYKDLAILHHEIAGSDFIDAKYFNLGYYTTKKIPYKGSQLESCIETCERHGGQPLVFDYDRNYEEFTDRILMEQLKRDLSEAVLVPLRASGKIFGVFLLAFTKGNHFDQEQLSLFKSIGDQMAIAVSNALANEAIQQRKQEEALKAKLVDALNAGASWEEKLLRVVQVLQPAMPFHVATFGFFENPKHPLNCTLERIGADEYRVLTPAAFPEMAQMNPDDFQGGQIPFRHTMPMVLNGKDFQALTHEDSFLGKIHKVFDAQSMLTFSFDLGEGQTLWVDFFSKQVKGLLSDHLSLLEKIAPSFQLALEKQLAYEKIEVLNEQLEQEKDYLVEEVRTEHNYQNIIGSSPVMLQLFQQIEQIAPHETTVLIQGGNGYRKRIDRSRHPQPKWKDRQALNQGKLCGFTRKSDRVRAFRARERRLYRGTKTAHREV